MSTKSVCIGETAACIQAAEGSAIRGIESETCRILGEELDEEIVVQCQRSNPKGDHGVGEVDIEVR